MATVTAGAVTPVSGSFATTPAYSGTFIPTLWSSKLAAKFYTASTFADICNRDWEGEISGLGDKVIINKIPDLAIRNYTVGTALTYDVPTPATIELMIDKAKYFGFQINDVLEYQAKPDLMEMFSNDASEQMRTVMDSACLYGVFNQGAAENRGATAGVKSASINLGTDAAPVQLTASTVLTKILEMAAVLDEQNVPESDRFLLLDPLSRTLLMQSNLAQANIMGDATSPVRNGMIGKIDRFTVYVTNHLPRANANGTTWISGDGSETSVVATTNANKRRIILAGHKTAISFASQFTKTETVRNQTDFGDFVRGLHVYGYKVTKPESLSMMVAY